MCLKKLPKQKSTQKIPPKRSEKNLRQKLPKLYEKQSKASPQIPQQSPQTYPKNPKTSTQNNQSPKTLVKKSGSLFPYNTVVYSTAKKVKFVSN